MPKCESDPALQDRIHRFLKENGLTRNGAAAILGVDRTTFWRFCESGRARSDTRASYREALENRNIYSATHVANKTSTSISRRSTSAHRELAGHELKLIRKTCEGVLLLLDAYETQALGRQV